MKKLYRSKTDRKILGVAGGIAEYFEVDSTIVRVVWLVFFAFTLFFPSVFLYLIMAVIMPVKNDEATVKPIVETEAESK